MFSTHSPPQSSVPVRGVLTGFRGFTLMELMITVVILAILTLVLIAGFKGSQRAARTTEAVRALGKIKFRQEEFFAHYGRYESSTLDENVFEGTKLQGAFFGYYRWEIKCPTDLTSPWCRIGFQPELEAVQQEAYLMRFQVQTIGWSSATKGSPPSFVTDTSRRWLTMQARGLPSDNGELCTLVRMTNEVKDAMIFGTHQQCD